jgi:hypothetical protein
MKFTVKLNVVKAVKANSRERFKDMPKAKRVEDKRFKKPRFKREEE